MAIFHEEEGSRFRYVLKRTFVGHGNPHRLCVWMNPSTADDKEDDASIRIGMSFAKRWDDAGIIVINVMDLVCTDSRELPKERGRAIGEMHWHYVDMVLGGAYGEVHKEVMCGWGDAGAGHLAEAMRYRLLANRFVPCALALTKSGNPGHPLRKSLDSKLVPFGAPLAPAKNYELEA